MTLRRLSPCKINLLLNILGRRPDGFHELETLFHLVPLVDELEFSRSDQVGIRLTCDLPGLSVDGSNLVVRAAHLFFETAKILRPGIDLHLTKRIPLAAGLGGGSSNAAQTLLGLNTLYDEPLGAAQLDGLAAALGSDVNFFLQAGPALAVGRGEAVSPVEPFPALSGQGLFLFHPGFGISTAWAFGQLGRFPHALNGRSGRAADLEAALRHGSLRAAGQAFYNSLEAPALEKFPILGLYQDFLREQGAWAALMSGSGSTTFALFDSLPKARAVVEPFRERFGEVGWLQTVAL